jgi:hypothetical protein
MTLCEQAIERAKELIRNGGINVDDFEFECHDTASGGPGDMIITYDVVVTRQSTQKHRTYSGSLSDDWIQHFEGEIRAGLFD